MSKSKAQAAARDKHDAAHFKYQSVKFKIEEYERLQEAVQVSGETTNGFMRDAINNKVDRILDDTAADMNKISPIDKS